jgi:hypothetical protein
VPRRDTLGVVCGTARRRTAAQRLEVGVGEVKVVNRAHRRIICAHGRDAESLAHSEGSERAVLVSALEPVKPLELRVVMLARMVCDAGTPSTFVLEPREVLHCAFRT